jgi:ribosomal protein S21
MIAIKILKNGVIEDLRNSSAYETIQDICKQHKEEQRALAFAFIIHNLKTLN